MNKALPFCKGQYYQFLNAGDTLSSNNILEELNTTIECNTEIFCGSINIVDDKGKKKFQHYQNVISPFEQMFCYHPATIARDYVFKKHKFDTQFKVSADYDWALRSLYHGFNFQFSDLPVVDFEEGGFSDKNKTLGSIENMFIQTKYVKNIENIFNTKNFSSMLSYRKSNNGLFSKLLNDIIIQMEEQLQKNENFIMYGFGSLGKILLHLYPKYFEKVYDRDFAKLNEKYEIKIYSPEKIIRDKDKRFIVTCLGHEKEVNEFLTKNGITKIFNFNI